MGYTKIVQYGNTQEVYQYSKEYINKRKPSHVKAWRLYTSNKVNHSQPNLLNIKTVKKSKRIQPKNKTTYRSEASIKRAKINFFRLVHHNNINAKTIHFLTLTFIYDVTAKEASRYVSQFMARVRILAYPQQFSFISVPEYTEKNRIHYHLLVYDLPTRLSGETIQYKKRKKTYYTTTERDTRNLQRQFNRGFLDITPATYTSRGIAGYMAKYMAKSMSHQNTQTVRAYNTSRNIKKITSYGSNSLSTHDYLVPTENLVSTDTKEYNVPYMGKCVHTTIIKIKQ